MSDFKTTKRGERREPIPYTPVGRRLLKAKFKDYADVLNMLGYDAVYTNKPGEKTAIHVVVRGEIRRFFSRRAVYDFMIEEVE